MIGIQHVVTPVAFALPITHNSNTAASNTDGQTQSFVTIGDLKDHLIILAVFNQIYHSIQEGGPVVDGATGLPVTSPAFLLSLTKTQQRFDLWISNILRNDNRDTQSPLQMKEIPPIDVLMFLHSYMLSPWNFYEDCWRLYPELAREKFPLAAVVSCVYPTSSSEVG
jgi:hypothetical protein